MPAFKILGGIFVLLFTTQYTYQASTLGERTLPELTASGINSLISTPDPIKQVDPSNPSSHLSKILIPRVCECINLIRSRATEVEVSGHRK